MEYFIAIYAFVGVAVSFVIRDMSKHQDVTIGYVMMLVIMGAIWPLTIIVMDQY